MGHVPEGHAALIFPAVLAGALLAFALSIDDFVTSNFVSGSTATFPLWVWGAVKVGIPPQVFVLGTMIFVVGIGFAVLNLGVAGQEGSLGEAPALSSQTRSAGIITRPPE